MFAKIIVFIYLSSLSYGLLNNVRLTSSYGLITKTIKSQNNYNKVYINNQQRRMKPLQDILGLGAPEIGIALVLALVLFGPETLKSLSKDFGKAAAELKEIPKTFKEGMDEGAESAQVSKMKAIAAEKRKKRDEKLNAKVEESEDDEEDEEK